MMYELNLALREVEQDGDEDDVQRLRELAAAIMQIHKWEWDESGAENDWGESQRALAIRTFEGILAE